MFRIIIPVYNAEKYLTETIESVIHQTLSFKENICIHLIDDASSDNSLKICNGGCKIQKACYNFIDLKRFSKW